MLRQNSRQMSTISGHVNHAAEQDIADIEALRAAYYAVMTLSGSSSTFPSTSPSTEISPNGPLPDTSWQLHQLRKQANTLMDLPGVTPELPANYKLEAGKTCQWLPKEAHKQTLSKKKAAPANRQLPKPIIRKSGEPYAIDATRLSSGTEKALQTPMTKTSTKFPTREFQKPTLPNEQALAASRKIEQLFEGLQPAPTHTTSNLKKPQSDPLMREEVANMLDMLNEQPGHIEDSDENLLPISGQWLPKALSRPKIVASVIGLCLLASTIYAGLGYWWLTATEISQAAEPNGGLKSQSLFKNDHGLENIKAIQNNIIVPDESLNTEETLLAQAGPMKTFTMKELKSDMTTPTGRPDPFSPLIQESDPLGGLSSLNGPQKEEKRDILNDLQYTGFIGDVNSKDIVAIIRVSDPAGEQKTLIKKVGESFYVEGERVFLKSIAKNNLTLRIEGVNRSLSLNPYQVITSAPTETTGNSAAASSTAPGGSGATPATSGGGTSPSTRSPSSGIVDKAPTNPVLQELR